VACLLGLPAGGAGASFILWCQNRVHQEVIQAECMSIISKRAFMYRSVGWPALLPKFWAIQAIMFRMVRRKDGLLTVLVLIFDLLFRWRTVEAREFRKRLLRDILLIGFAVWAGLQLKPWIEQLWAAATDGVVFQRPTLPLTLPPISLHDPGAAFVHYGWLLAVVAFLFYRPVAGVLCILTIALILFVFGASLAWVYALSIDGSWHVLETTTNDYFSVGHYLPVNMPMHTFMWDWGVCVGALAVYSVNDHLKSQANVRDKGLSTAGEPSGGLGGGREATSDDLRNGGLL